MLNGPARCGKDTLAEMLVQRHGFKHLKFTSSLKERVHGLYGMPDKPHDAFDDVKDEKRREFMGLKPRDAYIKVWEKYLVPMHGEGILIDDLIDKVDSNKDEKIVISDVGFDREANAIFTYYGDQAMLIKLQRTGCDFRNDIRAYVDKKTAMVHGKKGLMCRQGLIVNNGTKEELLNQFKYCYNAMYQEILYDKL
jgi:hypothetical protein